MLIDPVHEYTYVGNIFCVTAVGNTFSLTVTCLLLIEFLKVDVIKSMYSIF